MRIPLFLQIDEAKSLSALLHSKTGCVLFIKVPDTLDFPVPSDEEGLFFYIVLGLYKMYKDYGGVLFEMCLKEKQLPCQLSNQCIYSQNDLDNLRTERSTVFSHYLFIKKYLRHYMAHGCYSDNTDSNNIGFQNYTEKRVHDWFRSKIGKALPENTDDWQLINNSIIYDADLLFHWFNKWADIWTNSINIAQMQQRFYYGIWEKESCSSLCQNAYHYLVTEHHSADDDKSTFASFFSQQFLYDSIHFLNNIVPRKKTNTINGKKWDSSQLLTKNIDILHKEINFNALQLLRCNMQNVNYNGGNYCDFYRVYLSMLINEMYSLPQSNQARRSSSHWR